MSYVFHREILASQCNSVVFEAILGRYDGTAFKCMCNFTVFQDEDNQACQEILSIHLDTVEDLNIPARKGPVPVTIPPLSLEIDYPESPHECTEHH